MKILAKEILVLLQVLPWMILSAVAKPLPGCSQTSEIELYDPIDPAKTICRICPECPEGQGLTPQCGSMVRNDTKIECLQCQANVTYSNSHGIESCKACHECGLKNVIQHCTPDKNRKCGTKCPQGYFLDDNHICQECYFCCDSVSEAQRRQGCKDIGMSRDWQCEKTEQNRYCKDQLAFKKVTPKPTDTEPTVPPNHNTMTEKHVKTQVHDKFATTLPHEPGNNLTRSQILSGDGSTHTTIQGTGNLTVLAESDNSANAAQSTKKDEEKEEHGAVSLRVVLGVVIIIFIISTLALMTSKRVHQFCQFSRTTQRNLADNGELIPLNSICGHTDSGRASPQDNNVTTEEQEECGKEVCKPNPAEIPTDCRISEMEQLRDDEGYLMLFYIQKKLDPLGTSNRKTWRSIGQVFQVSSDDLNMIETEYIARRSPTESLLELLKNREKEPTMREFVQALIICDRYDVAHVICNWPWAKYFVPVHSDVVQ